MTAKQMLAARLGREVEKALSANPAACDLLEVIAQGMKDLCIPEHMHIGVLTWVAVGLKPAGFLRSVMQNRFYEATALADPENRARLWEWGQLLTYLPLGCWGSPERVEEWRTRGGLLRMRPKAENP